MSTRKVECGSCRSAWVLDGPGSVYEREAVESRPCPRCGAYTLQSPEVRSAATGRRQSGPRRVLKFLNRSVRMAG